MNGLAQRKVFTLVERPTDRNPLGTTMVYKYKIDRVKNTVTRKCRLCLRADWQKEGINSSGICFRLTLLGHSPRESWTCPCFVIHRLDLIVLRKLCLDSIIVYGAKQAPADFKSVMTNIHISECFTSVNDAQTVWIEHHNQFVLINAIFIDDVLHCTNDSVSSFSQKF